MPDSRNPPKPHGPATSTFGARKTEMKDRYWIILLGLAVCAIAVVSIFTFMSHQAISSKPHGARTTDTETTPLKMASASDQAEN